MIREVEFTDRATRDFDETLTWYLRQSATAATKWIDAVERAVEQLEAEAEAGSPVPESQRLQITLLQTLIAVGKKPTHRMVYAIRDRTVTVYAIRHLARDELTEDELS